MEVKKDQIERYKSAIIALKEVSLNNKGVIRHKDILNICHQNGVQKSILRGAINAGLFGEAGNYMYVPKFNSKLTEEQITKVIMTLRKIRRPHLHTEEVNKTTDKKPKIQPKNKEIKAPDKIIDFNNPDIKARSKKISILWGLFKIEY